MPLEKRNEAGLQQYVRKTKKHAVAWLILLTIVACVAIISVTTVKMYTVYKQTQLMEDALEYAKANHYMVEMSGSNGGSTAFNTTPGMNAYWLKAMDGSCISIRVVPRNYEVPYWKKNSSSAINYLY